MHRSHTKFMILIKNTRNTKEVHFLAVRGHC